MAFFSIIIPAYNRGFCIGNAIESVISQSFSDWELIVIDDGSTDNTPEIVKPFVDSDSRIKYVYQKNAERSAARNNGIDHANGTFVCFLDSDDIFESSHLQGLHATIATNSFGTGLYYCNGKVNGKDKVELLSFPTIKPGDNPFEFVLCDSAIATSFACVSRKILETHRFDTNLSVGEDRELWVRIVQDYPIHHCLNHTVVQFDHGDRTVDLANINSAKKNLQTSKLIISRNEKHLSKALINRVLASGYYRLAKSYLANNQRWNAVRLTSLALLLHRDKYSPSQIVFLFHALRLGFLLPSRFRIA
ncbi:MAG: glycosyltransferase [Flavobacteriales bacterium]|nr:glycosyltransferase [Flavobacteriales bacterium]